MYARTHRMREHWCQDNIVQVSVSEPPICIFITRELVTHMTSEAYVYIVDTVDSSPYKAMSRQLSVNVSILYVIKHCISIFYIPNFLKKVPIVAAASHSNVVYPFVVCPLNTFQVWKGGQLLTNKKSMESRKCHFLLSEIFISTILQIRQKREMVQKSFISTFLVCLFEIRISTIEIKKKKKLN